MWLLNKSADLKAIIGKTILEIIKPAQLLASQDNPMRFSLIKAARLRWIYLDHILVVYVFGLIVNHSLNLHRVRSQHFILKFYPSIL